MTDILGWVGASLILFAYYLISSGKSKSSSPKYHLMNLFGALGVVVNTFTQQAIPVMVLNIAWVFIAVFGLWRNKTK